MGILINALSISGGVLVGSRLKRAVSASTFDILGIGIMLLSIVGFIEAIFEISFGTLKSTGLITAVLSLITGSLLGNLLQLGKRINNICTRNQTNGKAIIEASLLFGIGGLQISGPILLALSGDNSQLYLKGLVDFPFALLFGATYGKIAALASLPVALLQLIVFGIALLGASFMNPFMISQICAMGYIILFFTGYNTLSFSSKKIENIDMLPAILVNILLNLIIQNTGGIL